jgi:hypothetical protein
MNTVARATIGGGVMTVNVWSRHGGSEGMEETCDVCSYMGARIRFMAFK